jgi:hypothetical protein
VGLAAVSLAMAGCGAEDALSGFAGGSSSKNKKKQQNQKQIPSMVKSSANAQPSVAPPGPAPSAATPPPATPPVEGAAKVVAKTPATTLRVEAPAAAQKELATTVPGTKVDAPVRTASAEPVEAERLREGSQAYTATRNRDPFRSLISSDQDRTQVVDLSVVTLVGVVWAQPRPFCIVEDSEGISYVLRKGDRVKNGRIVAVHRDKLVASRTILGYTTTVQLTLDKEKGKIHG